MGVLKQRREREKPTAFPFENRRHRGNLAINVESARLQRVSFGSLSDLVSTPRRLFT